MSLKRTHHRLISVLLLFYVSDFVFYFLRLDATTHFLPDTDNHGISKCGFDPFGLLMGCHAHGIFRWEPLGGAAGKFLITKETASLPTTHPPYISLVTAYITARNMDLKLPSAFFDVFKTLNISENILVSSRFKDVILLIVQASGRSAWRQDTEYKGDNCEIREKCNTEAQVSNVKVMNRKQA
jgi:hypothetical protein